MAFKARHIDNKIYTIIAIIIIIIIILTIILSTNQLTEAKIKEEFLGDIWSEDISESQGGSRNLGLEKWVSYTYRNNEKKYPAYITVTSIKSLFMMSEDELKDKTVDTIRQAFDFGININESTKISGIRSLRNGHKTMYTIYDGNNTSGEKIKIIGESWNCGISGTSVICIGVAQITNNSNENNTYWARIIRDKVGTFGLNEYQKNDGLLFNVKCH